MSKLTIPSFTNLGYHIHARSHRPLDADMSGKTVVITGASGGLGLAAASKLAEMGARTVIVARNPEKLKAAVNRVEGDVLTYQADLSLLGEIRDLATRLRSELDQIDVLINNVGVLLPERQVTSEGLETTFATNLAGHFLLTNKVASRLIESSPSRIINVTSGGMYSARIAPSDLQFETGQYSGTAAYAQAKRGQVILTEMWAERLRGTGIKVHSTHPGWAKTDGVAASLPTFNRLMRPLLRTPKQGADTIVWLASSEKASRSTGDFWFDRKPAPTHLVKRTEESDADRQALWDGLVRTTQSDLEVTALAATP